MILAFFRSLFARDYDWSQADAALKKLLVKFPGSVKVRYAKADPAKFQVQR
jgi:hypothetical protein